VHHGFFFRTCVSLLLEVDVEESWVLLEVLLESVPVLVPDVLLDLLDALLEFLCLRLNAFLEVYVPFLFVVRIHLLKEGKGSLG